MTDPQIQLELVGPGNWRGVADLKVRPDQERFVAPVTRYLALCAYGDLGWKANAIKLGDEYVGFVMSAIEDEDNSFWVGGFVIDENHRRRGYGRAAMQLLINEGQGLGCATVALSYDQDNLGAKALYADLGFQETDEKDGDEVVARLAL